MPKVKRSKTEAYIIIAILLTMGFAFVAFGRSEGYILVLMGFVLAVVGIPEIQFIVVGIAKGAYSILRGLFSVGKSYSVKRNQAKSSIHDTEQAISVSDADLFRIIDVLKHCPLPSKFRHEPENDAETWISSQLIHDFPDHKRQQHYSQYHSRFDIEIRDIGVEVKLPKGARDMATLRGQIQIYLKRFKYVVAFIINYYHINPELIDDFKKDMEKEYGGRVIVIERLWR